MQDATRHTCASGGRGGAKQVSNIEILFLNTLYILLLLSTHEDLQQEYNIEFFHVCIDI